jgi:hypothetical protein
MSWWMTRGNAALLLRFHLESDRDVYPKSSCKCDILKPRNLDRDGVCSTKCDFVEREQSPWQRHQQASLGRVAANQRQAACAKTAPGRTKIAQCDENTGIVTDSDLIEFALASVALEDNFAESFKESRGKVDPALKLGFCGGRV